MKRLPVRLIGALLAVTGITGAVRIGDGSDAQAVAPTTTPSTTVAATVPSTTAPATTLPPLDTTCTVSMRLELTDTGDQVECLETHLVAVGALVDVEPDGTFDEATDAAVRTFQEQNGLVVDGVVGPQTARQLDAWSGPDVLPPDPDTCPELGRSAVVDRFNQRAWLCDGGAIDRVMPMTSAWSQPDPGSYEVYARDLDASSTLSGQYSTMRYFVAFTYGKYQGARIAFHSVPRYSNGEYVQPLDSVGTDELHGDSSGCIRVLPDDAEVIWAWLDIGDTVRVLN